MLKEYECPYMHADIWTQMLPAQWGLVSPVHPASVLPCIGALDGRANLARPATLSSLNGTTQINSNSSSNSNGSSNSFATSSKSESPSSPQSDATNGVVPRRRQHGAVVALGKFDALHRGHRSLAV